MWSAAIIVGGCRVARSTPGRRPPRAASLGEWGDPLRLPGRRRAREYTATARRYGLVPLALASDPNNRRGHQICRGRRLRTTCIDLLYMTHHPQ